LYGHKRWKGVLSRFFLCFLGIFMAKRSNVGAFVGQLRRWRKQNPTGSKKQYLAVLRKSPWVEKLSDEELSSLVSDNWRAPKVSKKIRPAIKKAPEVISQTQTFFETAPKQKVLFAAMNSEESNAALVNALRQVEDLPAHLRAAGIVNTDGSLNRRAIQRLINQAVYT
jgi:hypothetical protein